MADTGSRIEDSKQMIIFFYCEQRNTTKNSTLNSTQLWNQEKQRNNDFKSNN